VDPKSPVQFQSPWECEVLGEGSKCSKGGDGCLESECCEDERFTCFKKNDHWADCKSDCVPGEVDPNSPVRFQSPWGCEVLGEGSVCSKAGDGCLESGCCRDPSLTCFQKNDHWADCKSHCVAGAVDPNSQKKDQSPWGCNIVGEKKCSKAGDGCLESGCCRDPSLTCYEKNDHWADCKTHCDAGKVDPNSPKEHQSPWTCNTLKDSEAWTPPEVYIGFASGNDTSCLTETQRSGDNATVVLFKPCDPGASTKWQLESNLVKMVGTDFCLTRHNQTNMTDPLTLDLCDVDSDANKWNVEAGQMKVPGTDPELCYSKADEIVSCATNETKGIDTYVISLLSCKKETAYGVTVYQCSFTD